MATYDEYPDTDFIRSTTPGRRPATEEEVRAARAAIAASGFGTDDIEVDDDAEVIPVQHGTWVSTWLYVARDTKETP